MTTMDDLVPWLREQIAEKRRRAMRTQWTAGGPPAAWTYDRTRFRVTALDPSGHAQGVAHRRAGVGTDGEAYDDALLDVDGEHMEFNDPQAAIAECDAHEALLAVHNTPLALFPDDDPSLWKYEERCCVGCGFNSVEERVTSDVNDCLVLRAVALAYQHRLGYREEWRP